jgi:hypothetical protein
MNASFNSPNEAKRPRDLSLNNEILNDSITSDKKNYTPSMNPYNPNEPNLSNRRASISINSTPKNDIGSFKIIIFLSY